MNTSPPPHEIKSKKRKRKTDNLVLKLEKTDNNVLHECDVQLTATTQENVSDDIEDIAVSKSKSTKKAKTKNTQSSEHSQTESLGMTKSKIKNQHQHNKMIIRFERINTL
jgi:hypothetical protein